MARELADTPEAAFLGGILTASMLGTTISFTLPVAMDVLKLSREHLYLAIIWLLRRDMSPPW